MTQTDMHQSLSKAVQAIKKLKMRVKELEAGHAAHADIAIVGIGSRFPKGVVSSTDFWNVLESETHVISPIPESRWDTQAFYDAEPGTLGTFNTQFGGFIDGVDQFDPDYWGISGDEARTMDPQQRLLLDVSDEALQDGGFSAASIRGSNTGVFIGMGSDKIDYLWLQSDDYKQFNQYTGTGNAHNGASGRLSYMFGVHGPSLTVDTACSSALTALHHACQSLSDGSCGMAICGGVSLILSPSVFIQCSQMQLLSPDGLCKAFDRSADGFGRSEGCGVLILKRLSDAINDGDYIRAVIKGSGLAHNGRSNGLTAPSHIGQELAMKQALKSAEIDADTLGYMEAHGTGSPMGDAIEMQAILSVYGQHNRQMPLYVGSVKSNFSHGEASSGIASIIKVVLSFEKQIIPKHLHFHELHSNISLDKRIAQIPTTAIPWPSSHDRRYAGVNSFGWSGQNAHVLLSDVQHDSSLGTPSLRSDTYVLPLSAKSPEMLAMLIERFLLFLQHTTADIYDICYKASVRGNHFQYRVCAVGNNVTELIESLSDPSSISVNTDVPFSETIDAYLNGKHVSWNEIYQIPGRYVSLPAHTGIKSSYWIS